MPDIQITIDAEEWSKIEAMAKKEYEGHEEGMTDLELGKRLCKDAMRSKLGIIYRRVKQEEDKLRRRPESYFYLGDPKP
jgi:hypothetical protein